MGNQMFYFCGQVFRSFIRSPIEGLAKPRDELNVVLVPLTFEVSDDLVSAMSLPRQQVAAELKKEMALGLYQRGVLSAGKATQLAGLQRWEFEQLLGERKIVRPFSLEDLEHDLQVADQLAKTWRSSEDTAEGQVTDPPGRSTPS